MKKYYPQRIDPDNVIDTMLTKKTVYALNIKLEMIVNVCHLTLPELLKLIDREYILFFTIEEEVEDDD